MTHWHFTDIVDLIHFSNQDNRVHDADGLSAIDQRDRTIFLDEVEPVVGHLHASDLVVKRRVLRIWLQARRQLCAEAETADTPLLPGSLFHHASRLTQLIVCLCGLITGIMAALSCLFYAGTRPVNVFIYLAVLVILPLILSLMTAMALLIRPDPGLSRLPLYPYLARNLIAMTGKLHTSITGNDPTDAARRRAFTFPMSVADLRGEASSLLFWPVFQLAQTFGVSFSIGALIITLSRVATTDLAFGWQTTLPVSGETLHAFLSLMATPWKSFIPIEWALPSPEQIAGSRIILKDGIQHLQVTHLRAWWPFLILSLTVYALVPRLLLLAAGRLLQQSRIRRFLNEFSSADAIFLRMRTPSVHTQSPSLPTNVSDTPLIVMPTASEPAGADHTPAVILVPDELKETFNRQASHCPVIKGLLPEPATTLFLELDPEIDRLALTAFAETLDMDPPPVVILIMEAWQPPIRELMNYLDLLRSIFGTGTWIRVCLMGMDVPGKGFLPPSDEQVRVWKAAIFHRKDPAMRVDILETESAA
ncbi:MAG: hypothetical protein CSA22_10690 [Deltaproteobacteria bacterium]|nr:MAG: hypothetical protein CSA22_10690 [Deltaproteobacteria bacterium]